MSWYFELEFVGDLRDEHLDQAAEGASIAHYQETLGVLRLRAPLDAGEYEAAMNEAIQWPVRLTGAAALVRGGVLTGPDRLIIETSAARSRGWDLLGSAEIAERLGVSTARVRQLEQRPDFPAPAVELAGGRMYRADDIAAFGKGWHRAPGRPRKRQSDA
ncbi:hypothetical protein [Salinispora pacifica]|uniref:hypothetical protein n=1 Tax=Salinispora pacifica TaxID=351187 RepID=UPI00036B3E2E|nr:hypothetical protein [Salinispora pacifica]